MSTPALAAQTSIEFNMRDVTAQDFKLLAQATTPGHGGKRALLQSTDFSDNFYRILGAILQGDSGDDSHASCDHSVGLAR